LTENKAISLELATLLSDLIAIPSVNPMGREGTENAYFESRLTDYLEKFFHGLQLPVLRQRVAPLRENILARLDPPGRPPGQSPLLLIDVHQDTVPTDQMRIEPFSAKIEDQRIYGRGACDVKGGMAAALVALRHLAENRPSQMPTLVLACTVNEEHGFSGATELTKLWSDRTASAFLGRKPDACIVTEPTELQVITKHKGVVRWRCHTTGRAAHSSQAAEGENAIYRMGRVLQALELYAEQTLPQLGQDPLCGQATLSVGTITGGISVNTIPDRCTIEIDRRLLPGESPSVAYNHAVDELNRLRQDRIELVHDPPMLSSPGLSDEKNGTLAQFLLGVANDRGGEHSIRGVPYGTNAGILAASGVPSVVFGPGSIQQAHTADEWIDIRQLQKATEILCHLATVPLAA